MVYRLIPAVQQILRNKKFDKLWFKVDEIDTNGDLLKTVVNKHIDQFTRMIGSLRKIDTKLVDILTKLNLNDVKEEYIKSIETSFLDFVVSLYEPSIQQNSAHTCPHRWFNLKLKTDHPCIDSQRANDIMRELNLPKVFTPNDCITIAYDLLDYIETMPLPPLDTLLELAGLIYQFTLFKSLMNDTIIRTEDKQKALGAYVKIFNNLTDYPAYVLSTRNTVFTFPLQLQSFVRLPELKGVIQSQHNLNTIMENLLATYRNMEKHKQNRNSKWFATFDEPLAKKFLDFRDFEVKVNRFKAAYYKRGGSRRRTRKLRS